MNALRLVSLLALAALMGCDEPCKNGFERYKDGECYPAGSFDIDTGSGVGFDTSNPFDTGFGIDTGETGGTPLPQISVTWSSSSVILSITGGQGRYWFGMAETGQNCSGSNCWTGEDCMDGFEVGDGTLLRYCHPAGATGVNLAYGGDPMSLEEGAETLFFDATFEDYVTYYLEDDRGACFTWGDDPSYYSRLGCTEL